MKQLPDSLIEKIGVLPVEEAINILSNPDCFKKLNLTFMEFVCLSEYLTELCHTLKSADTDFSKLEEENKKLRKQLEYRTARCEDLESKIDRYREIVDELRDEED